jgi:hypothetical protein
MAYSWHPFFHSSSRSLVCKEEGLMGAFTRADGEEKIDICIFYKDNCRQDKSYRATLLSSTVQYVGVFHQDENRQVSWVPLSLSMSQLCLYTFQKQKFSPSSGWKEAYQQAG